jgi:hypothetical protein
MWFLSVTLLLTTLLLCYAGYIFLIVDRRQEAAVLEDDLYGELDEKNYNFDLPEQIDIYEDLRVTEPTDKCAAARACSRRADRSSAMLCACSLAHPSLPRVPLARLPLRRTLPLALLERAKGDIPRIEQLERDHPRMARLFQKGLLPFCVWEQLLEAETLMDQEVNSVQAEAERLQKGWGAGVFSQAYQMLRKDREDELRAEAAARDAAVLSLSFTKLSGGVVSVTADGRKVTQQTQLVLRKECAQEEIAFKTEVRARCRPRLASPPRRSLRLSRSDGSSRRRAVGLWHRPLWAARRVADCGALCCCGWSLRWRAGERRAHDGLRRGRAQVQLCGARAHARCLARQAVEADWLRPHGTAAYALRPSCAAAAAVARQQRTPAAALATPAAEAPRDVCCRGCACCLPPSRPRHACG